MPILFLLYINDLTELHISGHFTLFADDTSILWQAKDIEHLKGIISKDLSFIKEWFNSNHLCLNLSKTHVVGLKCNRTIFIAGKYAIQEFLRLDS